MSKTSSPTFQERRTFVLAAVAAIAAGVSHGRSNDVLAFLLAAAALSLLAVVVGHATENLGHTMSPGATGVLQGAFGNLPELLVCLFSLKAGLVDVVKGALIGSILANSVLVLGLAILAGGLKNGAMKFRSAPPRMIAVLMLLACSALAIPTLAQRLNTPAARHEAPLSLVCSVVLVVLFFCSLPFFLGNRKEVTPVPGKETGNECHWSAKFSMLVLALGAGGSAFVSDWFVDALKPATHALGLSEAFTGLVVVAIAGNAVENLVGVQLAMQNKGDYALSVILNSSLQIALLLAPVLVMASFFIGPAPMDLVISPMALVALLFAAIMPAWVVFDGEAIWLEGAALIGLYVLIAAAFWWG